MRGREELKMISNKTEEYKPKVGNINNLEEKELIRKISDECAEKICSFLESSVFSKENEDQLVSEIVDNVMGTEEGQQRVTSSITDSSITESKCLDFAREISKEYYLKYQNMMVVSLMDIMYSSCYDKLQQYCKGDQSKLRSLTREIKKEIHEKTTNSLKKNVDYQNRIQDAVYNQLCPILMEDRKKYMSSIEFEEEKQRVKKGLKLYKPMSRMVDFCWNGIYMTLFMFLLMVAGVLGFSRGIYEIMKDPNKLNK